MSSIASNQHCMSVTKSNIAHHRDNIDAIKRGVGFKWACKHELNKLIEINKRYLAQEESLLKFCYLQKLKLIKENKNEKANRDNA